DDEEDGDEVVAHVEAAARVLEGLEAALVGRELLAVGALGAEQPAEDQQRNADPGGHDEEEQDRQVFAKHSSATSARLQKRRGLGGPLPERIRAARAAVGAWFVWCPGRDSNPHSFRHYPLKIACLPVPPPGQGIVP